MLSSEFALAIALLRAREAGENVTDEYVLAECAAVGVDPAPVMMLVQRKAPAAWAAYYDAPDGSRRLIGLRLEGVWFDLSGRDFVVIDSPETREAFEILKELDGIPEPRCYPAAPEPGMSIHPRDVPRWKPGA